MEVGCSSCVNRRDCDFVVMDDEGNWVPDEGAVVGQCPNYEPDMTPLMEAGVRQATVQRVAQIAKESYPDHLVVQAYIRIQRVEIPVNGCGDCPDKEWCGLEPDECEQSTDTGETEPGEFTKFVVNIQTSQRLTDEEGIVRQQEIQAKLQEMNDDEINIENCVFEISFVYVEPSEQNSHAKEA